MLLMKRSLFLMLVMILAACSSDTPEITTTGGDDSVSSVPDDALNLQAIVCRAPFSHSDLGFSAALGINAWYYTCAKYFENPSCSNNFTPLLGSHYTLVKTQSSTPYSEGGIRISYRCKGPMTPNAELHCVHTLNAELVSTSEFEQTYECSLSMEAPYCHADFRTHPAEVSGATYNWEGGWGPGTLKYRCARLMDEYLPPEWPPM